MRAKRLSSEARREQILDVAMEMFVNDGFAGTSISEVERRVGFKAGTGSFYRHFGSKEELFQAAVDREVDRCMRQIEDEWSALQLPEDPRAAMKAAAKQMLRDIQRFDGLSRLVQAEGDRIPELRQAMTDALGKSQALGPWVDDATRLVGIAALLGFHQFQINRGGALDGVTDDDFIETLVGLLPPAAPEIPHRVKGRSKARPIKDHPISSG